MSFGIDDIIWLDTIAEKIAWKHSVLPQEVEEIFTGKCRIFRRESGKVEGDKTPITPSAEQKAADIYQYFLLGSLAMKP